MTKKTFSFPSFFKIRFKRYLFTAVLSILLTLSFWIHDNRKEETPSLVNTSTALYSNQTADDLTHTFFAAIDGAQHSIFLVVYSLTDSHIIAALKNKSLQGVSVSVVCDAKASPYIASKLGSKVHVIRRFSPGLMHQKILVVDQNKTWIGSANMTMESLKMHGNLVTAIHSPSFAGYTLSKINTLKEEGRGQSFSHKEFMIEEQPIELWFLPDNPEAVLRLKSLIRSANKTIRIAMFTWTRQDLAKAVIAASKRGVDVKVVIDYYSGKGASAKIVQLLKENGISIGLSRGGPLLHHKFLYVDGNTLVNGSANWTKAAFRQNDDCFIVMRNLTIQQKGQMESLWKTIHSESLSVK